MKRVCLLLLLATGFSHAQVPTTIIRRDSMPSIFPPDLMPNARPNNSFYRYSTDSRTMMRATLDQMPVKVPDSSTHYTILRSYEKYLKPDEPMRFQKPVPRITPKKYR